MPRCAEAQDLARHTESLRDSENAAAGARQKEAARQREALEALRVKVTDAERDKEAADRARKITLKVGGVGSAWIDAGQELEQTSASLESLRRQSAEGEESHKRLREESGEWSALVGVETRGVKEAKRVS